MWNVFSPNKMTTIEVTTGVTGISYNGIISLLHLMNVIACTHTSTCATSLMRVKNCICHFYFWRLLFGILEQRKWKKNKNIKFNSWSFLFNLLWAWLLYFHAWLQNKGKFLVWSEYYNHFGIYQPSHVSLLEPQKKT